MTWDSFDADWTEDDGRGDENLPFTAAYTRDDGIRLELYTWQQTRVIEVSNSAGDVVTKTAFGVVDGEGKLIPIQGFDSVALWRKFPSIAVAVLRYAERTWHATPPLASQGITP